MPVPVKLGIDFTQADLDAMEAGAQVIIDTIASKITLNLSVEERESLSKLGDDRRVFVHRSVQEYAPMYPQFNPLAYTASDADKDLKTFGSMEQVLIKITEANELCTELQMVAGHFSYLFMRKQYEIVESNKDQNVTGAQVVYDGLKDAFEGQGNFGDEETGGGDTPTP